MENLSNEQLIIKFELGYLSSSSCFSVLDTVLREGYLKTGNKFDICFVGSKGYLSHISISCECWNQTSDNVIWIDKYLNKDGSLKSKTLSIFHSQENGVRVEISPRPPKPDWLKEGLKKQKEDLKKQSELKTLDRLHCFLNENSIDDLFTKGIEDEHQSSGYLKLRDLYFNTPSIIKESDLAVFHVLLRPAIMNLVKTDFEAVTSFKKKR